MFLFPQKGTVRLALSPPDNLWLRLCVHESHGRLVPEITRTTKAETRLKSIAGRQGTGLRHYTSATDVRYISRVSEVLILLSSRIPSGCGLHDII